MILNRFSRVKLAEWPTPLQHAKRLTAELGGPEIWMKRDDVTGLGMGGNKLRKLEYLMADAMDEGADVVITTGGTQSNHARLTAAAASKLGIDSLLVLGGFEPDVYEGNLLLDRILGAGLRFAPLEPGTLPGDEIDRAMEEAASEFRDQGRRPYIIPLGGSVPLGVLGYIGGMLETEQQARERGTAFDHVFVASGSGGTTAGVLLGLHMLGGGATVHAVSVGPTADDLRDTILDLATDTATLLGVNVEGIEAELSVHDGFVGGGYGAVTDAALEAMRLFGSTEGVILDSVYTAKAAACMMALVRSGTIPAVENILFLHTGGGGGLFAKAQTLHGLL